MKRLYSYYDSYLSNECCMLYDLFRQKKLEYIHVETRKRHNLISYMIIDKNLDKLRYLNINTTDMRYDVTLDVS